MSWSVSENVLTQTATEVPTIELALSESALSVPTEFRLMRRPESRNDRRVRPSRASSAGRRRRGRRAADFTAIRAVSRPFKNRRIIAGISFGEVPRGGKEETKSEEIGSRRFPGWDG